MGARYVEYINTCEEKKQDVIGVSSDAASGEKECNGSVRGSCVSSDVWLLLGA